MDDQGPGVPRRDRTRVWERFTRLEHRGRAITGAGIGLAVVRDLAERHGGAVRLEEQPGGGARVVVTLATIPASVEAEPTPTDPPEGQPHHEGASLYSGTDSRA